MQESQKGPSKVITLEDDPVALERDLENLKKNAIDLGASMAEIIPAEWIEIDERVRLKCSIPTCPYFDKSIHCPPHSPDLDLMRKTIDRYHHAILFALDIIPTTDFSDHSKGGETSKKWANKCLEITGKLETLAFGNGYHLAMGFSQASCLKALCGQDRCLVLDGGKCPYPLKSRPSMESVGIDVYRLVTKVGWDVYPIYRSVDPEAVRRALSVGIVFIK